MIRVRVPGFAFSGPIEDPTYVWRAGYVRKGQSASVDLVLLWSRRLLRLAEKRKSVALRAAGSNGNDGEDDKRCGILHRYREKVCSYSWWKSPGS